MKSKAKKTGKRVAGVTEGSGNVFADLGVSNPEQELLQAKLTLQIYTILKGSRMTRVQVAKNLGVRQTQASLLMRNRTANFTVERLTEFLTALRYHDQVSLSPPC
jgi:predicted XRE-type DNA-binding protein